MSSFVLSNTCNDGCKTFLKVGDSAGVLTRALLLVNPLRRGL